MLSKDELIEKMAGVLDGFEDDSVGWQNRTEMWKNVCRNKAEVVLQALLDSLPEPSQHDSMPLRTCAEFYGKLIAMRDK